MILDNQEATDMILSTSATERMRILSGGNVGIGTPTPTSLLDVEGNTQIVGDLYFGSYDGATNENI